MISIEYKEDNYSGDYIEFSIDTIFIEIDTYYFELDECIKLDRNQAENKVKHVIIKLFSSWHEKLNNSIVDKVFFLPLEFSDQYIGCLKCSRLDFEKVDITYGYTTVIKGHAICPSEITQFSIGEQDFRPSSEVYHIKLFPFLATLTSFISSLRSQ